MSKEDFSKITRDGRLVLYRGLYPNADTKLGVSYNFKYGDFYYPYECAGMHCANSPELPKWFAAAVTRSEGGEYGAVLQFCFTDVSADKFNRMQSSELFGIGDYYKYFHVEDYLEFMLRSDYKYILKSAISGFCSRLSKGFRKDGEGEKLAFIARALGCDCLELQYEENGVTHWESEFTVFNRGKLTVCAEDY